MKNEAQSEPRHSLESATNSKTVIMKYPDLGYLSDR